MNKLLLIFFFNFGEGFSPVSPRMHMPLTK